MSLRARLIRLAYNNPELRESLLPLMTEKPRLPPNLTARAGAFLLRRHLAKEFATQRALDKYLREHPKSDPAKHRVRGKPSAKDAPAKDAPAKGRQPGKDLSKQPGFESLKGLSPAQQRKIVQQVIEKGEKETSTGPTRKERQEQERKQIDRDTDNDIRRMLKKLSPSERNKVLQRALKMASRSVVGARPRQQKIVFTLTPMGKGYNFIWEEGSSSGRARGVSKDEVIKTIQRKLK